MFPLESVARQLSSQRGLVDHAGGFGFVVQAFGVDADEGSVCSGLPVGNDDVPSGLVPLGVLPRGTNPVKVGVSISAGFVSVGGGDQAGQFL